MADNPKKHPVQEKAEELESIAGAVLKGKDKKALSLLEDTLQEFVDDLNRPGFLDKAQESEVSEARTTIEAILGQKEHLGGGEKKKIRRNLALAKAKLEIAVPINPKKTEGEIELNQNDLELEVVAEPEEDIGLIKKFEAQFNQDRETLIMVEVMTGDVDALKARGIQINKTQLLRLAKGAFSTQQGKLEHFEPDWDSAIRKMIELGFVPNEITRGGITFEKLKEELQAFKGEGTQKLATPPKAEGGSGWKQGVSVEMGQKMVLHEIFFEKEETEEDIVEKLNNMGYKIKDAKYLKLIVQDAIMSALKKTVPLDNVLSRGFLLSIAENEDQMRELINQIEKGLSLSKAKPVAAQSGPIEGEAEVESDEKILNNEEDIRNEFVNDPVLHAIYIKVEEKEKISEINEIGAMYDEGQKYSVDSLKSLRYPMIRALKQFRMKYVISGFPKDPLDFESVCAWIKKGKINKKDIKVLVGLIERSLVRETENKILEGVALDSAEKEFREWTLLFNAVNRRELPEDPEVRERSKKNRERYLGVTENEDYEQFARAFAKTELQPILKAENRIEAMRAVLDSGVLNQRDIGPALAKKTEEFMQIISRVKAGLAKKKPMPEVSREGAGPKKPDEKTRKPEDQPKERVQAPEISGGPSPVPVPPIPELPPLPQVAPVLPRAQAPQTQPVVLQAQVPQAQPLGPQAQASKAPTETPHVQMPMPLPVIPIQVPERSKAKREIDQINASIKQIPESFFELLNQTLSGADLATLQEAYELFDPRLDEYESPRMIDAKRKVSKLLLEMHKAGAEKIDKNQAEAAIKLLEKILAPLNA